MFNCVESLIYCNCWYLLFPVVSLLQTERNSHFRDMFGGCVAGMWRSQSDDPGRDFQPPLATLSVAVRVSVWEKPTLVYSRDSTEERRPAGLRSPTATRSISASAHATGASLTALFTPGSSLGMKGKPRNTLKEQLLGHVLPLTVAEVV